MKTIVIPVEVIVKAIYDTIEAPQLRNELMKVIKRQQFEINYTVVNNGQLQPQPQPKNGAAHRNPLQSPA